MGGGAISRDCYKVAALVCASALVLVLRRPDQVFNPAFWAESGQYILVPFAERGFASITEPVQGYHILVSKLIELGAFGLSFSYAAPIAAALTFAFTLLVVLAIAYSPTHLKYPAFCALAALLVPTDSEVFGVSLFAFWWAGLLLVLAVLWRTEATPALRVLYVVAAGLSSPLIVPAAAILAIRAVIERAAASIVVAAVAIVIAGIQIATVASQQRMPDAASLTPGSVSLIFEKFFGLYFAGAFVSPPGTYTILALIVIAALALLIFLHRPLLDRYFVMLLAMWLATVALAVLRSPGLDIHPIINGARYYFYPYILTTWTVAWIAALAPLWLAAALLGVFILAVANAVRFNPEPTAGFTRRHEPLQWRQHVERCAASAEYPMPFHKSGVIKDAWIVTLRGEQCAALRNGALLHRFRRTAGLGPQS